MLTAVSRHRAHVREHLFASFATVFQSVQYCIRIMRLSSTNIFGLQQDSAAQKDSGILSTATEIREKSLETERHKLYIDL